MTIETSGCPSPPADAIALTSILEDRGCGDIPPRPENQHGYGCYGCPYSSHTPGEDINVYDESEGYYDCRLLSLSKIWGENPKCTLEDWRTEAKRELAAIRAKLPENTDVR